jgi:hypothetical protein
MNIDCTPEYLRAVITGQIRFRKCPLCDGTGMEIQAYDENGQPCGSDVEDSMRYPCDNCSRIGFIELPE